MIFTNALQNSWVLLPAAFAFAALAASAQTSQIGRLDFLKSKDPSFALFVNTSATPETGKHYPDELVLITGLPANPTISARIDLVGPSKSNCQPSCNGLLRNAVLSPDGDTAMVSTDSHNFGLPSVLYVLGNIRAFARSKNPNDLQVRAFSEVDFPQLHTVSGLAFGPDGHWAVVNTDGPGEVDGLYKTAKGTIVVITGLPDNPAFSDAIDVSTHSLGNIDLSLDGRTLLLNDSVDFSGIPSSGTIGPKSDQLIVRGFRAGNSARVSVVSTISTPKGFPTTGPSPVQEAKLSLDGRFILAPLDLIQSISQQTLTGLNQITILGPVKNGHLDTVRLLTEADGVGSGPANVGVSPDGDSALISDNFDNGSAKLLTGLSSGDPAQIRVKALPFQFFGPPYPLGASGPPVLAPHSEAILTSDGETALVSNWVTPVLSSTGLTPSVSVLTGFQSGNIRLAANLSDPTLNPVNLVQQISTQPAGLMDYITLYLPVGTLRDTLTKGINSAIDQADRQQDAFTPLRDFVLTVNSNSGPGKALKSSQGATLITLAIAGIQAIYGRVAIVSGAGFAEGPLAPESIGTIFGSNFAASQSSAASLPLPTSLLTTQVTIVDSAGVSRVAPLFMVSPNQINFLVPKGIAWGRALAMVQRDGQISTLADFDIDPLAPGLFTVGASSAAAAVVQRVKADGSQSYEPVSGAISLGPETDQVYLLLFGTGIRVNGGIAEATAQIGTQQATVTFAGPQGSFDGLDQVNVLLPRSIAGHGPMNINVIVDGYESNKVVIEAR